MTLDYYTKMKCYKKNNNQLQCMCSPLGKNHFNFLEGYLHQYMEQKHLIRIIKEISLLSLQLPLWSSMVYTTDRTFGQTSLILIY